MYSITLFCDHSEMFGACGHIPSVLEVPSLAFSEGTWEQKLSEYQRQRERTSALRLRRA